MKFLCMLISNASSWSPQHILSIILIMLIYLILFYLFIFLLKKKSQLMWLVLQNLAAEFRTASDLPSKGVYQFQGSIAFPNISNITGFFTPT